MRLQCKETENNFKLTIQNPITTFQPTITGHCGSNGLVTNEEREAIYTTLLQLMKRLEEPSIIYEKETVSDLFGEVLPLLEKLVECLLKNQLKN